MATHRRVRGIKEAFRNYYFIGCCRLSSALSRNGGQNFSQPFQSNSVNAECCDFPAPSVGRALFLSHRKAERTERAKIGETDESDVPCFDKWPRATRNEQGRIKLEKRRL